MGFWRKTAPARPLESRTILLVDDDRLILALYSTSLEKAGFTVLQAKHADQALAVCKNHPGSIDLLVTDLFLPPRIMQLREPQASQTGMNGLALLKQVQQLRPRTRAIVMSAHSEQDVERMGAFKLEQAGIPFLKKPFKPETLLNKVTEVLGRPSRL
jgi:CheY-like chemotaxis protein